MRLLLCADVHASCPPQGFSLRQLQHLVLDEADRILSLDFEEDIDKILKARSRVPAVALWHFVARTLARNDAAESVAA